MNNSNLKLYIEINSYDLIFFIGVSDEQDNYKIVHKLKEK